MPSAEQSSTRPSICADSIPASRKPRTSPPSAASARLRRAEIQWLRDRHFCAHGADCTTAPSRTRVSRAAKASAGFSPSITRASSKRSQIMSSNFSFSGAPIFAASARIKRMGGVDFEHRLRCRAEPAARRQHPFKPAVRPAIGRDEAGGARRQPVGSADILDRFAQDLLHKRVKGGETCRRRLGRGRPSSGFSP